jgi:hypothetical protein
MSLTIISTEQDARPGTINLTIEDGSGFSVYAVPDDLDSAQQLRTTILRPLGAFPPAGANLVVRIKIQPGRAGQFPVFKILGVGRYVELHWLRPDVRSKVTTHSEVRSGARLEVQLENHRRIIFTLEIDSDTVGDTRRLSGGGTRKSRVLPQSKGALWLVPTAWSVITDQQQWVMQQLRAVARKLGLGPRAIQILTIVFIFIIAAGIAYYMQWRATKNAEEEATTAVDAQELAEAARQASLMAEMNCLSERGELVAQLGDIEEKRKLMAEQALLISQARGVALEAGGTRMGTEEVLAFDNDIIDSLHDQVVYTMAALQGVPSEAHHCLAHEQVLGADLPPYILLWHSNPEIVCPVEYASVAGGVTLLGRWGLSSRAAKEFGTDDPALGAPTEEGAVADLSLDPRMNDRWSAYSLAAGVRAVQSALLGAQTGDRPPVAPSQSQIWSLALWHAYNSMPSTAGGTLDKTAGECVTVLIEDLVEETESAQPGEPIVPDVVKIALEEKEWIPRPTPGCPWPSDALYLGAKASLQAAAHLANVAAEGGTVQQ